MRYICTGGEGNGVKVTRETPRRFGAIEGLGAVGPGQVEVGHGYL
jgi:hypothetical protein